jgi:glycosyltransferase involved in cell wall biosynthesis
MAADCSVIAGDHPDSAADEVIGNAGFLTKPTVECIAETVEMVLSGKEPDIEPFERAQQFDWDNVASQAEDTYRSII